MPRNAERAKKVQLRAGEATPGSVARDLGPLGVDLAGFCRVYNELTASHRGHVVAARVTVSEDRRFTVAVSAPTTASLLRHAAGLDSGATRPNGHPAGWIGPEQLRTIARTKLPDLNTEDEEAAVRMIAGTARSMGIGIRD